MLERRRGQSTLEYITVFVVIVAAIVVVAFKMLNPTINKLFNATANKIDNAAGRFANYNINVY
jgi:Flp pilus assembly pilin Flp